MDWGREVAESEEAYTKHLNEILDRPRQAKEEKRAVSEIAVKKGLPYGITRNIAPYIGSAKRRKSKKKKTRRVSKKKTSKRK
jgi:hypothetical protein